jgi:hypothetical protein
MKHVKGYVEFISESTLVDEGLMGDVNQLVKDTKSIEDFVKAFFKEYGDKIKQDKKSEEWVRGLYKDSSINETKELYEAQKYDIEASLRNIVNFNRKQYDHHETPLDELAIDILKNLQLKVTGGNVDDVVQHLAASMDDNDKIPNDRAVIREIYNTVR